MSPHHEHHEHDENCGAEHEMSPPGQSYLVRLSELDYELEEGSPNVIGWGVADRSGNAFGKVDDLLVDMNSGQILFGIISHHMAEDTLRTLVPLAGAQADEDQERLVLPMDADSVRAAPPFKDETEDIQQHFEYWMTRIDEWAAAMEEDLQPGESRLT